jgi:hypothetical protein
MRNTNVSYTDFIVSDINWGNSNPMLPTEATVAVSHHLTGLGYEDFEPEGFSDSIDDLDEDEADAFWDDYEPSEQAQEAFEKEWDDEIKRLLQVKFGTAPLSFARLQGA